MSPSESPQRAARRFASRAFTIIEILIAIVVLVLGITGIIALFPTAIESGNQTVEDSYASAITQSVVDAITVGVREARYIYTAASTPPREWTYFIFTHDGVVDPVPSNPQNYQSNQRTPSAAGTYAIPTLGTVATSAGPNIWDKDYCILLPQHVNLVAGVAQPWTTSPPPTNNDITKEPYLLNPVPLLPVAEKAQRQHLNLDSDGEGIVDNLAVERRRPQLDGSPTDWIPRVYKLGTYRDPAGTPFNVPTQFGPGHIRDEFRGEAVLGEETIATDPYPNYGYAFAIRRARIDTNENGRIDDTGPLTGVGSQDDFSNSLFILRVMIFKNFDQSMANDLQPGINPGLAVPRTNVPIRKFVTLISL